MINAQIADLSSHTTKYTSPALTQKVFANMRNVGKGFPEVDTPLFDGMLVPQQVQDDIADAAEDEDAAKEIFAECTPPSPTPATTLPPQQEIIPSPSQVDSTLPPSPHQSPIAQPSSPPPQQLPFHDAEISMTLLNTLLETCATLTKQVANLEYDKIAQATKITKLKQRVGRLEKKRKLKASGLKRLRKVGTAQRDESSANTETNEAEPAEIEEASAPRRRRGVIIQYPKKVATASLSMQSEQTAKKQKIDEEVDELKTHLQIISNDEDDVYTEATPLSLNVPIVDYQIYTEHNKPYYKIIRADGTHQLFLSFINMLRNFDREDLEMLWKIFQEIFKSSEPKSFSDDFSAKYS
nr:hypothetical protein [Tanacetum cinerariifolium]